MNVTGSTAISANAPDTSGWSEFRGFFLPPEPLVLTIQWTFSGLAEMTAGSTRPRVVAAPAVLRAVSAGALAARRTPGRMTLLRVPGSSGLHGMAP